jgi:hypothetical protein
MRLRAKLESTGKTTTGFEIPESFVEDLAGGRHPKVTVTVNNFTFRTSIASMGGRYLLGVSADRRKEAKIEAGQTHDIDITLDTAPRETELPDDFAAALSTNPAAQQFWNTLSHSKQSWHVHQVTSAKKPETRAARIEKSITMLGAGQAR